MIPFEQAFQVGDVDQIEAHLKISIDKFQGGCIKFYLYKWKELTSDMEVIGTVSGMPINIASNLSTINRYQYSFNDKEDAFIGSEIQNLLKKGVIKVPVMSQVNLFHQYFTERKEMVAIFLFLILKS